MSDASVLPRSPSKEENASQEDVARVLEAVTREIDEITEKQRLAPTHNPYHRSVVLQVLPEMQSGGVERGTVEVAKAIAESGKLPIVVSAGGRLVRDLYQVGAKHVTLPLHSKNPFTMRRNIEALVDVIKEYNVDIVHARSRAPAWSAYKAAQQMNIPFVTTFHGTYGSGNVLKRYYNSVMARGQRVIAVSEFIKQHILERYKCEESNICLVHRGADLEIFNPDDVPVERVQQLVRRFKVPQNVPIIMLPGRITRWKGQEVLLGALKELRANTDQPFFCLLVGDYGKHGKYKEKLEYKIKVNGLQDFVRVTGNVSDMPAAYALSDIVVSASTQPEAFGRIAVEGQAMGKLVIASEHGGSKETVIPGKTGWLVEPGNVSALAETLAEVLSLSDKQRKKITESAKNHIAENFSVATMCKKTIAVYDEILELQKK